MKTVSVFDMTINAVRDHNFTKGEALQIIDELRSIYPDVFEQAGLEGNFPADFAERLPGRQGFGERISDTERTVRREDIEDEL
jgi:hypothetical protein